MKDTVLDTASNHLVFVLFLETILVSIFFIKKKKQKPKSLSTAITEAQKYTT